MSPRTSGDDAGMWRVVAVREFMGRVRDRGFLISTGITLVVLTAFILIGAFGGGGPESFDLGVAAGAEQLGSAVAAAGRTQGIDVRIHTFQVAGRARSAVADGSVDAALIAEDGRTTVLGAKEVPDALQTLIEATAASSRIGDALAAAGRTPDEIAKIADPAPIPVRTLEPPDPDRQTNEAVALVAVLLLYGQLFGYGVWVATGVIEEKASRVVEVLLAAIRAKQLLAGKVIGIGALGLLQLIAISVYAVVLATVLGALDVPARAIGAVALALGWFVLGFAFYACLFAVAGSLVSRMDELQNATTPLNLLILASFFISISALGSPDSTTAVIASLLPFSAALAMPVRIVLGGVPAWQIALSLAGVAGSVAVLVPVAGRMYAGAVLRMGPRVKLREAWRAGA